MKHASCVIVALLAVAPLCACDSQAITTRPPADDASGARAAGASGDGAGAQAMMPTPYTADQIRASNPPGTLLVFRIEDQGQSMLQMTEFVDGGMEHATIESSQRDPDGRPLGQPRTMQASWDELRRHASFPAAHTTRHDALCEVPAGRYHCWVYEVERDENGVRVTTRYWFARSRPGPPVKLETERHGAVVYRMELIEDSRR